ncbi:hypothetical protein DERF_013413 [Dermatophagoides farinae]|uniref:Uncharacterized protein n=1 Tax=Dermatophagoides farinae TaxID=6954 RepID=A0A922HPG8_DERFA|nr:uncharacterized protein LOC124493556 [Dermatophagoides farinae]KAH7643653.1 hypothetical protein HUG17_6015 [Dermatophagoides farinae]KAH9497420.1 hypothetical protein DERF_013413 [Dermatophagoides farinae]
MATFFGEVNDISSRSAWWSDSDCDDETVPDDDVQKTSKLGKFSINYENGFTPDSEFKFERIYVTNVKSIPKNLKTILTISIENVKVPVCYLNLLNNNDHPQCCWLAINHRILSQHEYLTVQLVDYLFDAILKKLIDSSKPELLIISKQKNRSSYVQYLRSPNTNDDDYIVNLGKKCNIKKLMAPETSNDEFELATMQHCIIHRINFIFFILPTEYDNGQFVPKTIRDSLNQFYDFSHNNNLIV